MFIGEKVYEMINICTHLSESINGDCLTLRTIASKIEMIRQHSAYKHTMDWTLNCVDIKTGMTRLVHEVFDGKSCRVKTCYRALTLYVYVYDLCILLKDNDVKRDILKIVDRAVNRQSVDWTLLMDNHCTSWDMLQTFSLKCIVFVLSCYHSYLKM